MTVAGERLPGIAESLRLGVALDGVALHVHEVTRIGPLRDLPPAQPTVWTFVEFTVADADAPALAEALAATLDAEPGWYCDFRTTTEAFVVFTERVFRYPRRDVQGRQAAADHARSVGVPDRQIDWPEQGRPAAAAASIAVRGVRPGRGTRVPGG